MSTAGTRRRPAVRLRDTLAVPFALVRVPLSTVDRLFVHRLGRGAGPRVAFDCMVGTVDILAGNLLGDGGITQYGVGRVRAALDARDTRLGRRARLLVHSP